MSWHYSLALVEEFSERGLLVTASSVRLKTSRTASRSCFGGKRTGRSTPSQSGMTSDHLTVNLGMAASMSCLLDSPANPSPKQDSNEEKTTTETFGLIQRESLARYDQELSSWRTHPDCFGSTEPLSSAALSAWGMIVSGELYQRTKPGRDTSARDGGAWPTPTVNTRPNEGNVRLLRKQVLEGDLTEAEATSMLNGKSPFSAQGAVPAWPTPTASDRKGGGKGSIRKDTGKRREDRLDHLLEPGQQGKLSPDWVEWLMGWPSGWTSLDPLPEGTIEAWETSVKAGTYWDTDPADTGDVPRLTEKKENRASRLKAIGNGQVPAQILLAWEVLGEGRRKNG